MKSPVRLFGLLVAVAAAAISAAVPATASGDEGGGQAVFIQTNDLEGNAIAAYHRNGDGTLTWLATYPTGGLGGRQNGAGSDPIASQGSLVLVREAGLLLAVNAGSNTISVFQVSRDRLHLTQVLPSNGPFPSSFGVHDNLAYVLDAGGEGFVSGYRIAGGRLHPLEGSTRALGLGNPDLPPFLSSPAQVGFTPDGAHLIVTTKTHNTVDVFSVGPDGRLSRRRPVKNPVAGTTPVPFAFVFDGAGRMILNFAGNSSLQTFTVNADNTITPVSANVSDTQEALCWVTPAAGYEYTSNTASGNVSQFKVTSNGTVVLVNPIAASGIAGATDSATAGGFLYVVAGGSSGQVETNPSSVYAFSIGSGGALSRIQIVSINSDDIEGIAVG